MVISSNLATDENIADLARVIMSEASVGNDTERILVGFTIINRLRRNRTQQISKEWHAYAHNQEPTKKILGLAKDILTNVIQDISDGATHFYSPCSMPFEGDEGKPGFKATDTGGGLEKVTGLKKRNYRPSWSISPNFTYIPVEEVREKKYKFYRKEGMGPVE